MGGQAKAFAERKFWKMKRICSLLLCAALACALGAPALAAENHKSNFEPTKTYSGFSDVWSGAWYAGDVETCYEYGLMTGSGGGKFTPGGTLTVAQALAIADRIHEIYTTGKSTLKNGGGVWYQPYVDYALENGIIEPEEFSAYDRPVTRGEAARIFAAALPPAEVHAINDIDHLTDVPRGDDAYNAVLLLYNAGVLTGSGPDCRFRPEETITRAEIAAIACRMALPAERETFVLLDGHDLGDVIPGLVVYMTGAGAETEDGASRAVLESADSVYRCLAAAEAGAAGSDVTAMTPKEGKYALSDALAAEGYTMDISTVRPENAAFGDVPAYRYEFRADDGKGREHLGFGYVFVRDGALCTVTFLTTRDSTEFRKVIAAPALDGQTAELT